MRSDRVKSLVRFSSLKVPQPSRRRGPGGRGTHMSIFWLFFKLNNIGIGPRTSVSQPQRQMFCSMYKFLYYIAVSCIVRLLFHLMFKRLLFRDLILHSDSNCTVSRAPSVKSKASRTSTDPAAAEHLRSNGSSLETLLVELYLLPMLNPVIFTCRVNITLVHSYTIFNK